MGRLALALVALIVTSVAGCGERSEPPSIAVGAAAGPKSALVAHLYAAALRSYGSPAHVETEDDSLIKLDAGDVRVVPGYTGRLLSRFVPDATARSATQVYRDLVSALPEGVAAGDYTTSAENKPALAVTESTAEAWGGRDVTAAMRHCDTLKIAQVADESRPETIGTCTPEVTEFPDSATMFEAVLAGRCNAAWKSTAAPDVPEKLITLSDRTSLIRAQNLVPLYRRNTLNERQVLALNEVAGVLDTAGLARMFGQVDDGADPADVAGAFLAEHPLGD